MSQIVTINGRPQELKKKPYLSVGNNPIRKTPVTINGKMTYGVNINGYSYIPAQSNSVLYFPGLPGYGSTIWDRSDKGNNGTITGATWVRLPSGLWVLSLDGNDDSILLSSRTNIPGGNNAWSYMVWCYPKSFATENRALFATGANDTTRQMAIVNFFKDTGSLNWYSYSDDFTTSGLTGTLNTWQLVGVSYDGARGKLLYLSGSSATDTMDGDYNLPTTGDTSNIYFGRHTFGGGDIQNFSGYFALSRIINTSTSVAGFDSIYAQERHLFGV